jgi:ubiquinone/menaquinone biosynthesis C-methylase UbiE
MFLKKGPPKHQTALAMVGAKAAQTVVILGGGDVALAAEIALATGLNGRTVVADRGAEVAQLIEMAAARAGALVEHVDAPLTRLPIDAASADIVVVLARLASRRADERDSILAEAVRIVRAGKRVVVIEGTRRAGVFGALASRTSALDAASGVSLLQRAHLVATRLLGEAEGVAYFEGVRPGSA